MILFFEIIVFTLLGLVLGSFSTALIYRVPRRLSWGAAAQRRSSCPQCKAVLGARDLVPVFSYLFQRGRCRHCRKPISPVYLWAELTCLVAVLAVYAVYGLTAEAFLLAAAAPFLTALLFIDLEHMILPNALVATVAALGVAFHGYGVLGGADAADVLASHGFGALVYGGLALVLSLLMRRILGKEALGLGDVKFFAVAGLWLGLGALPEFCILAGFLGILIGLAWRFARKEAAFPFGPALIASLFCLILVPGLLMT